MARDLVTGYPLAGVLFQEADENVGRALAQVPRNERSLVADAPEEFVLVAAGKRRLSRQHFVKQYSKGPPIYCLVVFQPLNYLQIIEKLIRASLQRKVQIFTVFKFLLEFDNETPV